MYFGERWMSLRVCIFVFVCLLVMSAEGKRSLRGQGKVQVEISPSTGNSMNKIPSK